MRKNCNRKTWAWHLNYQIWPRQRRMKKTSTVLKSKNTWRAWIGWIRKWGNKSGTMVAQVMWCAPLKCYIPFSLVHHMFLVNDRSICFIHWVIKYWHACDHSIFLRFFLLSVPLRSSHVLPLFNWKYQSIQYIIWFNLISLWLYMSSLYNILVVIRSNI